MMLAGIPVAPELVRELASRVDEPTGAKLQRAVQYEVQILALDIGDRQRILWALADPPAGLEELRAVLLQEQEWRQREGL